MKPKTAREQQEKIPISSLLVDVRSPPWTVLCVCVCKRVGVCVQSSFHIFGCARGEARLKSGRRWKVCTAENHAGRYFCVRFVASFINMAIKNNAWYVWRLYSRLGSAYYMNTLESSGCGDSSVHSVNVVSPTHRLSQVICFFCKHRSEVSQCH